jgi:hypothetical protein
MKRKEYEPRIMFYTEGQSEAYLLKKIKRLTDSKYTVRSGKGGDPESILSECIKQDGDFDVRYLIVDGDKIKNKKEFLKLIENTKLKNKDKFCLEVVERK